MKNRANFTSLSSPAVKVSHASAAPPLLVSMAADRPPPPAQQGAGVSLGLSQPMGHALVHLA